jgi:hypothetical protein
MVNRRGKIFMTPTLLSGNVSIRAAFVNYRTVENDIDIAFREMDEVFATL